MIKGQTFQQKWKAKTIDEIKEELAKVRATFTSLGCSTDEEYERERKNIISYLEKIIEHTHDSELREFYLEDKKKLQEASLESLKNRFGMERWCLCGQEISLSDILSEKQGKKPYMFEVAKGLLGLLRANSLEAARSHKTENYILLQENYHLRCQSSPSHKGYYDKPA